MKKYVLVFFSIFMITLALLAILRLRIDLFPLAFSQSVNKNLPTTATTKKSETISGPTDMPIPPELLNEKDVKPLRAQPSTQVPSSAKEPPPMPQKMPTVPSSAPSPLAPLSSSENLPGAATQVTDPSIKFINTEGFSYDPTGRRDPFKSYLSAGRRDEIIKETPYYLRPDDSGVENLESYDLSLFKLVGILWDVGDPKAVLRSPTGKVFMVHKQTKIGKNNGYIASIREGEIVVVELSADGKSPMTRVLGLQK